MSRVLVYKYGLRRPTTNSDLVIAQMDLAHHYYNKLIEIYRRKRDAFREALRAADARHGDVAALSNAVTEARDEWEAARQTIKDMRAAARGRVDTAEDRLRVKVLRDRLRGLSDQLKSARAAHRGDKQTKADMDAASDTAKAEIKAARAECGIYWGTYNQIESAAEQADKTAKLWRDGRPCDPRFRRWSERKRDLVAVQLQGGLPGASAMDGGDSRLRLVLDPLPEGRISKRQAKLRRGVLQLRVGSEGRRLTPVFADWPLQMHRPLPQGAVIKLAKVVRSMIANHDRWELHLTLEVPDAAKTHGDGTVAVDIGWRITERGMRVAYVMDEGGQAEEVLLDPAVLSGFRKAEDLRSIRDKNKLALGKDPSDDDQEAWRRQDLHLWQWEAHQRRKSAGRRKDAYRCLAKRLSERYDTVVLESKFLSQTQRHEPTESDKPEIAVARRGQRDSACYELKSALINAFSRAGGRIVEVNPSMTTQRCAVCGCEDKWDASVEVEHTCSGCGATWDQDANACRNMLAEHSEQRGDEVDHGTKRQAKWSKLGRHKATARNATDNGAESCSL